MGNLADLLFELSSEERMAILGKLVEKPMKLSHVATKLKITVAEASRHLQRLADINLIKKDTEGLYELTPYGGFVLSLLPGLDFISQNTQYFSEHTVMVIPPKFRSRIGALSSGKYIPDTLTTLRNYWDIINNAEEFTYSIKTNPMPVLQDEHTEIHQVENWSILQGGYEDVEGWLLVEGVRRRYLEKVEVFLLVTEKEALFGLPFLNGKMDYSAFVSEDPDFREWCKDLFQYYWDKAKPNSSNSM